MTYMVDVHEASMHLSRLLDRVSASEVATITRAGKPIARLVPFVKRPAQRTPGSAMGKITMADDFMAPLPDELLKDWEG